MAIGLRPLRAVALRAEARGAYAPAGVQPSRKATARRAIAATWETVPMRQHKNRGRSGGL